MNLNVQDEILQSNRVCFRTYFFYHFSFDTENKIIGVNKVGSSFVSSFFLMFIVVEGCLIVS